jgi:lysophospholipase L1-like esterase
MTKRSKALHPSTGLDRGGVLAYNQGRRLIPPPFARLVDHAGNCIANSKRWGVFPVRACFARIVGFLCLCAPMEAQSEQPPQFDLHDGDRIVFVGDTLIERDQRYGYLETLLSISNPDKNLIFRNLGWSGDTVGGISRSGFDRPEAGFEQLRQQILAVKPTVVVVGYGMADSFAGEAGLPAFEQGLSRLLNVIDSTKARVAFLSPVAHANFGRPLPDPTGHNRDLVRYRDLIKRVAKQRSANFVNLFEFFDSLYSSLPAGQTGGYRLLTDDGIHLTKDGYWNAALLISVALGQDRAAIARELYLEKRGEILRQAGTSASDLEGTAVGLRFKMVDRFLPLPEQSSLSDPEIGRRRLWVRNLPPGRYDLKIDGATMATASSEGWKEGVTLKSGPEFDQVEALRVAINRKNELFFYRWRPQNITYLLGFRKHEQGNNAVEIPQFDPLVAEQEKTIARLKKPVAHVYELSRVEKEVGR